MAKQSDTIEEMEEQPRETDCLRCRISTTKLKVGAKENLAGTKDSDTYVYREVDDCIPFAEHLMVETKREKMTTETYRNENARKAVLSDKSAIGWNKFVCELCGKDLTTFNSVRRQQHINRCCDQADSVKERNHRMPEKVTCPLCSQLFRQERQIASHLKTCGSKHSVIPSELIKIVEDVKQQWQTQQSLHQARISKRARPVIKQQRNRRVQPARGMDDDLLLAMALSASLLNGKEKDSEAGVEPKRKKRTSLKNVEELPPLLLRSKEQEDQVISARAGQILIPEVTDSQEITPTPVFAVSTVAQQSSTPVNCQLKHQTSPIETKTANEPDSDSSDMETGGQDMREPMRVEMALGKTNADTSAQTDAQGSSKMPHTNFWSLASSRMTETSVEQYYVHGLIDIPDHVRMQFEYSTGSNSGSVPVEPHSTDEEIAKEEITGKEYVTQSCCQLSQGFLFQPLSSPKNEYKSLTAMEKGTQSSVELSGCEELQQHFGLLINSRLLTDVTLVAKDNCHIFAHQVFLAARSPVFAEMFSDTDEAEFSDCSDTQTDVCTHHRRAVVSLDSTHRDAVMAMLHYIYTGSCALQPEFIEELIWLADRFQLKGLQKLCTMKSHVTVSSPFNETAGATLAATVIQRSGCKQDVQNSGHFRLISSLPVNCNEYHHDNCSQSLPPLPSETADPRTVEMHSAQGEFHNDDGHLSPQIEHSPRIEGYDPMSPSDKSTENESCKLNGPILCTPSPCLSVQSTEDVLEEQVMDMPTPSSSPELPSLRQIIFQPLHPSKTYRDHTASDQHKESGVVSAWDESMSDFPVALLDIRTPCFIPETPIVSQESVHRLRESKSETAPIPVVWNTPEKHDSEDDTYEEAIYEDWISGDCMSADTHQNSHEEVSKLGNCNKQPLLVMSSDDSNNFQTVYSLSDGDKVLSRDSQCSDVKRLESSTGVAVDAQPCSVQITYTDGSNGLVTSTNTYSPIEVDMCDEEDELFTCCIPDDELVASTDTTDSHHSVVIKQRHARPTVPQVKKAMQCVTPMPDYDNMATPVLKKNMDKFGMRNMAKRKMITKLKQVYHYTHPGGQPEQQEVDSKTNGDKRCQPEKAASSRANSRINKS